jgi:phage replication O-like protein O
MANPQKENGYTPIANEIMDALISADISGQEFKIALLIIRKTYGFNKNEDAVSLSQMESATGMIRVRCSQVVNRLQLMKIITVTENINGIGKKYKFNKNFDSWQTVKENINRYRKTKETVNVLRKRPLKKSVTTKDTLTKDTLTKDNIPPTPYPDWLPVKTFEEYQSSRKKKLKPAQYQRFFARLKRLSDTSRASPEEILDQSIANGWEGVFGLKEDRATGKQKHSGIVEWLDKKRGANEQ